VALGAGDEAEAVERFGRAAAVVPLPEYVIALAEAQESAGDAAAAERSYELARAEIDLFAANGVAVDLELALFEADHGDPSRALAFAEAAYDAAPTVRAADALGWALYRLGRFDEAADRSAEALRLGSVEPLLRYHAGAIAASRGLDADAEVHLKMALAGDAGFSASGAAHARDILETLPD
jgi:tetratricopeptide (TPR) repeat protein